MISYLKKGVVDFFEGNFNAIVILIYVIPKMFLGRAVIRGRRIDVLYPDTSRVRLVIGKGYLEAGAYTGVSGGTMAADEWRKFEQKMFLED